MSLLNIIFAIKYTHYIFQYGTDFTRLRSIKQRWKMLIFAIFLTSAETTTKLCQLKIMQISFKNEWLLAEKFKPQGTYIILIKKLWSKIQFKTLCKLFTMYLYYGIPSRSVASGFNSKSHSWHVNVSHEPSESIKRNPSFV